MTNLHIALVVPASDYCYDKVTLSSWIQAGEVDLVAFPECFLSVTGGGGTLSAVRRIAISRVKGLAEELHVPVLAGVSCGGVVGKRSMYCAAYWNPMPAHSDTREHFYAKHSTSDVLPYELPDYSELRDAMFAPIRLKEQRLGVQVCHDQFFGLIATRLVRAGANVLFNLTGESVVRAKWFNVVAGRSLEHHLPYFCTMARSRSETTSNVALAFGFRDGAELIPRRREKSGRNGDLVLFTLDGDTLPRNAEQAYSPIGYNRMKLALAPSVAKATLRVGIEQLEGINRGSWQPVLTNGQSVGVLFLPAERLRDPLCIHMHENGESSFDAHIVCFTALHDVFSQDEAIILARLRAIEHRVAIVICTPTVREVIKASRYKNIQRMRERDGVFGLDLDFLRGTYATMEGSGHMGIPKQYQREYRRLLEAMPSQ